MKENKTILLVDDEIKVTEVLQAYLENEGYAVLVANDGKTALDYISKSGLSLIVLDLMLPDIMGEDICKYIRKKSRIPIIMLTAKASEQSLIQGLGMGADDYIIKPFSPRTVLAKIDAVLRRTQSDKLTSMPFIYDNGNLIIDFEEGTVKKFGVETGLTPTEHKILTTMAKAPGRIFTRDQLISFALDNEFSGYDRSIDTYIKSLRRKIEVNRRSPRYIVTVHGIGYRFMSHNTDILLKDVKRDKDTKE